MWPAIISAVGAILGGLLAGRGKNDPQTQTTTTPAARYESPMRGIYDLLGSQLSLGRYGQLSGAGMPGGVGAMGNSGDVMAMLSKLIPELSGAMMNGGLKVNPAQALDAKYKECIAKCTAMGSRGPAVVAPCLAGCEQFKPTGL